LNYAREHKKILGGKVGKTHNVDMEIKKVIKGLEDIRIGLSRRRGMIA
jgi:hypothetical protein